MVDISRTQDFSFGLAFEAYWPLMVYFVLSAFLLVVLWQLLWAKQAKVFLGLLALLAPAFAFGAFYLAIFAEWEYDHLTGWRLELTAERQDLRVSLVQYPGMDLYSTEIQVIKANGALGKTLLDWDDSCWGAGTVVEQEGVIYFVPRGEEVHDQTPFWNPGLGTIGGYGKPDAPIAMLEFSTKERG